MYKLADAFNEGTHSPSLGFLLNSKRNLRTCRGFIVYDDADAGELDKEFTCAYIAILN